MRSRGREQGKEGRGEEQRGEFKEARRARSRLDRRCWRKGHQVTQAQAPPAYCESCLSPRLWDRVGSRNIPRNSPPDSSWRGPPHPHNSSAAQTLAPLPHSSPKTRGGKCICCVTEHRKEPSLGQKPPEQEPGEHGLPSSGDSIRCPSLSPDPSLLNLNIRPADKGTH